MCFREDKNVHYLEMMKRNLRLGDFRCDQTDISTPISPTMGDRCSNPAGEYIVFTNKKETISNTCVNKVWITKNVGLKIKPSL